MSKTFILPISHAFLDDNGLVDFEWYDILKLFEQIPLPSVNAQTGTSYTFVGADASTFCTFANASPITVTVPPNASVPLPVGTTIPVAQLGAGKTTLAAGAGVTLNSVSGFKSLSAQYAQATLLKTATDTWLLYGSLIA